MGWRPHYVHKCDCEVFLCLLFIHLLFIYLLSIHSLTDNCLFRGHASSKIKHIWLAVGKWDIWWSYGVRTKQGTVHGLEYKAQHSFTRRLTPSALQKASCLQLLSHFIQPHRAITFRSMMACTYECVASRAKSMAKLRFDLSLKGQNCL